MQISSNHYDVIIIGGGAIGLSVAYHLGHRLSSGKKSKILLSEVDRCANLIGVSELDRC